MLEVHLVHHGWSENPESNGFARGAAFLDGSKYNSLNLLTILPSATDEDRKWTDVLNRSRGFYAAIKWEGDQVIAVVDHVRSMPLFYGVKNGQLFLSDSAEWVRVKIGAVRMNKTSRAELVMSTFVSGQRTLFDGVCQLQAGEYLKACLEDGELVVRTRRFYRFSMGVNGEWDSQGQARDEFKCIIGRAINRLIDYADRRQIVIPLSSGHDSRLIAMMLRQRGYDNVLTYTYGVKSSKDAQLGGQVAAALGFRWLYVEYSTSGWERVWRCRDRKAYQMRSSGWASLPHIQDWLAVKELHEKHPNSIAADAVIVPGHGAMAILSHLNNLPSRGSADELVEAIIKRKYHLSPVSADMYAAVRERVYRVTKDIMTENNNDIVASFATFEWQERQSKYLVNSLRLYEFFGYDWWMPLWDLEFANWLHSAPRAITANKSWYKATVDSLYSDMLGSDTANNVDLVEGRRIPDLDELLRRIAGSRYGRILRRFTPRSIGVLSPMAFEGQYTPEEWRRLRRKGYKRNGMAAQTFLDDVEIV